jgi:hypothetical protein
MAVGPPHCGASLPRFPALDSLGPGDRQLCLDTFMDKKSIDLRKKR